MINKFIAYLLLACAVSCDYHSAGVRHTEEITSVSIPFVQGDSNGELTAALSKAMSNSGAYQIVGTGGELTLKVSVLTSSHDRIGFRYDRKDTTGQLEKNLLPVETRKTLTAEVTLLKSSTEEVIMGPTTLTVDADYDYVNPDSVREMIFFGPDGAKRTTIDFSLGQLDSIEGAQDDATVVIFDHLAEKIVQGILATR